MPANTGRIPKAEFVDLKLRNGHIVRNVDPAKWRWKPWDWGESDWDIVEWQIRKEGK